MCCLYMEECCKRCNFTHMYCTEFSKQRSHLPSATLPFSDKSEYT